MPTDIDQYVREMLAKKLVHECHQSEMRSFSSCRRRWSWVFQDNYYPPLTIHYLEFGVAFHKALEVLHNPATWKFEHTVLGALAEKAFVDVCNEQKAEYLEARRKYALEDQEAEDYEARVILGRGMIQYYVKTKLPEIQRTYVPVAVETSFDIPLLDNRNYLLCKCKRCRSDFAKAGGGKWRGNPVVYSGRTDAVVHDMHGNYFALDWKSTAQFRDSTEDYLSLDMQVGSYLFALRRALGLNIQGFIYFQFRKAFPEPPTMNKTRRKGCWFSVNKTQATNYEVYLATIKEEDKEGYESGAYNDFLAWLKASGPQYFRSFLEYKHDYELDQIEKNLALQVRDMLDPDLRIYPSPGEFNCSGCAFKLPCKMKNTGEDYQYALDTLYERREPYYRKTLKKYSTESRGAE